MIGTGAISHKHAQAYKNIGYQLVVCTDINEQVGRSFAEQYGAEFVDKLVATGLPFEDLIATATALTAATVAAGIERFVRPRMRPDELIVSGGGAHNPELMGGLAALLPGVAVATSADFGIDIDAKEAIAFAVLAYQTWRRRPGNLPSATGARRAAALGRITPGGLGA